MQERAKKLKLPLKDEKEKEKEEEAGEKSEGREDGEASQTVPWHWKSQSFN